jgi:hypothetical protein
MVNFLQQTIKQPENLRHWFNKLNAGSGRATEKQAEAVGIARIEIPTIDISHEWLHIYEWCQEHGVPDRDFFLYWFSGTLIGYFRNPDLALMFKLRWG